MHVSLEDTYFLKSAIKLLHPTGKNYLYHLTLVNGPYYTILTLLL